ncbi:MAG: hypothetical protein OZ948_10700 [Deltaproteobacteria bacterium]|nr:hypothetical protein [Deltaproteobacteria bacterium]
MPSIHRRAVASTLAPVGLAAILVAAPDPARAFAVLNAGSPSDLSTPVEQVLGEAPRWSADARVARSLRNGIEVFVHPDFEEDLGAADPSEVEVAREAVRIAFAAWENPALHFRITFDSPGTIAGPSAGGEIDVFTRSASEDPFLSSPTTFGFGDVSEQYLPARLLPNGQLADGVVITGGEVALNATLLRQTQADLGISIEVAAWALTRLLMHEIGHTLGFAHPNEARNFDTDLDPDTGALVDPLDPFAGILDSPNFLQSGIMSNDPCGGPFATTDYCLALLFQELQPDDRLGRDVLYAAPEPGSVWMRLHAVLALLGLAARRHQRAAHTPPSATRPSAPR